VKNAHLRLDTAKSNRSPIIARVWWLRSPDRYAHARAKSPLYLMVDSSANIRTKVIPWISPQPPYGIRSRPYFCVFRVFRVFWSFSTPNILDIWGFLLCRIP